MPKLFYNRSIYKEELISDLNPLLLEAYPKDKILILCAREQQALRLRNKYKENQNIIPIGWWELIDYGFISPQGQFSIALLVTFPVIVILDKDRIDESFLPIVCAIEKVLWN